MTEWRPWPRDPRHLVGDDGTILGVRGRPRRPHRNKRGYLQISIDDEHGKAVARLVHQVVCETFHGPRPPGMEVAHDDGDQANNRADNLLWKTHSGNTQDMMRHGRLRLPDAIRGESHHLGVLTEDKVRTIRTEFDGQHGAFSRLARKYGVHVNTIRQVVNRETWKHVS